MTAKQNHHCCDYCEVTAEEENRRGFCSQRQLLFFLCFIWRESSSRYQSRFGRFVSTTSMVHRTNTWEKKWQWGKGMLLLNQQGLLQTAHQELHNPCSGVRKWFKILEEILLLGLKNKINFRLTVFSSGVPRNVVPPKNQFLNESVSNAGTSRALLMPLLTPWQKLLAPQHHMAMSLHEH